MRRDYGLGRLGLYVRRQQLTKHSAPYLPAATMLSRWRKTAALFISALCAALNLIIACQIFVLWHTFKHNSENESEGLASAWVKALNVLGGLVSLYFLTAAGANIVGFVGIVKVRRILLGSRNASHRPCQIGSGTHVVFASGAISPLLIWRVQQLQQFLLSTHPAVTTIFAMVSVKSSPGMTT
jgi:hypothetical protein